MTYAEKHSPTFHILTLWVCGLHKCSSKVHACWTFRPQKGCCWNFQEFGPNGRMLDHSKCTLETDTGILTSLTLLPGWGDRDSVTLPCLIRLGHSSKSHGFKATMDWSIRNWELRSPAQLASWLSPIFPYKSVSNTYQYEFFLERVIAFTTKNHLELVIWRRGTRHCYRSCAFKSAFRLLNFFLLHSFYS